MTPELFAIGGGVVLLILAALGGGIEAKEVKVPQISSGSRALCAIAGIALVSTGVYLKAAPTTPSAAVAVTRPSSPEPTATNQVRFTIADRLGDNQLYEIIEVFIEGKKVGALEISRANPVAVLEITLPTPNDYQYRLSGKLREQKGENDEVYLLTGSGTIQASKGNAYYVEVRSKENFSAIASLKLSPNP